MITIPDEIKEILVGILLGDGLVRKVVNFALLLSLFSPFLWDINISLEQNTRLALDPSPILGLIPVLGFTPILSYSDPETEKATILLFFFI